MTDEVHGLVDTNVVILRADLDADELPDVLSISAVTLAELTAGPHHTDDLAERARRVDLLQRVEAAFDPLPLDTEATRAFGRVTAAVLASGRKPRGRLADLLIASTAIANRLPLYTTNPDDYRGTEDLLSIVAVTHPDHR
ncbi:MAG TPA: type II toxin-antitoxin system VapC family toxin [Kribbellaceae bacterium]